MKRLGRIVFFVWCILARSTVTYAAVTITAATLGTNLSADRAANATAPVWTTLGTIQIQEGVVTDLPANQTARTIILTAPPGWEFRAGIGTHSILAGRDITVFTGVTTTGAITWTITTDALANATDRIRVTGIQVRSTSGHILPNAGNIKRLSANPGTATVVGITNDVSNFGALSQVTGAIKKFAIVMPGQTFSNGIGATGTPNFIFPNVNFVISKIWGTDQFYNTVTAYAGAKTLSYTGVSAASGANIFTTAVTFTAGGSTTTLNTTLRTPGSYMMKATEGTTSGTTSSFIVGNGQVNITAPSSLTITPTPASSSSMTVSGNTSTTFTVEDQKGTSTGHYTTLQCDPLTNGTDTIPNTAIAITSLGISLLSGNTNPSMTGYLTSPTICNGTHVFMDRPSGGGGAGIYSLYGATLNVSVTIPPYQSVGTYTGNIIYTLISY